MKVFLALGVTLATLIPARVDACSCVAPRMTRLLVPADGAEAFPTNGILRVYLTAFPERLRLELAREYRLRGPEGEVTLRGRIIGTRLELVPTRPLRPSSTYTLEQIHAYDSAGNLLSDTQRARPPSSMRGVWFPISRFTTAAGAAAARARPITLASASFDFRFGGGDCGPGVSLAATAELPQPLRDSDFLELRVVGLGVVDSIPLTDPNAASARLYASNTSCNPDPVSIAWMPTTEIEVILRDAAGHELGSTGRQAATGSPANPGWRQGRTTGRAELPAWGQIRMVQPAAGTSDQGPDGCPHGFEVTHAENLVERGGPWMYGARSTLASDSRRAWLAFEENQTGPPARIVRVDGVRVRAFSTSAVSGIPRALIAGRRGPIVLSQTYQTGGGPTKGTLTALRGQRAAWSHDLGEGDAWRIAMGSQRLIAGWRQQGNLSYAMFDARSGDPIRAPLRTAHPIDRGSSEGAAVAHIGDRFLFAWTPNRGHRSLRLNTMVVDVRGNAGDAREIAVEGAGIPDMVGLGDRAALVTSNRGRIQLAMIDRDGDLLSPPQVIGVGTDNRVPRIAYNGRFFAIGWESHPQGGAFVVAADRQGRVSPVLRLDHGERHAGTIGLAPSRDGFFASFTTNYEGTSVLRALRCRESPPARAPSSIGPA